MTSTTLADPAGSTLTTLMEKLIPVALSAGSQKNRILPVSQFLVINALARLARLSKPDFLHFLLVEHGLKKLQAHRTDFNHLSAGFSTSAGACSAATSDEAGVSVASGSGFFSSAAASGVSS